jgi:hypothetical protein
MAGLEMRGMRLIALGLSMVRGFSKWNELGLALDLVSLGKYFVLFVFFFSFQIDQHFILGILFYFSIFFNLIYFLDSLRISSPLVVLRKSYNTSGIYISFRIIFI